MATNGEEHTFDENSSDYAAAYGDYNLAAQEYEEGIENPENGDDSKSEPPVKDIPQNEDSNSKSAHSEHNTSEHNHKSLSPENSTVNLKFSSASKNDDDERKIFVGGLHWETSVGELKEYFQKYGRVVDSTLKTDPNTGRSRGFGFVLFDSVTSVDKVMAEKQHVLQGKTIDPKRAMARGGGKHDPCKKIFVGGISPDMPESEIRSFFGKFGKIEEVELPYDRVKSQRRAYVFVTFENEKIAEEACSQPKQKIGEREVDVRRATPRAEGETTGRGGSSSRGRGRGGHMDVAPIMYPPGYDYSSYYNYAAAAGYPGYPTAAGYSVPGYDYSAYYGQDWSQYSQYAQQYAGYPGAQAPAPAPAAYDYSSWYGQQDPAAAATAGKMKRGSTTPSYHPYAR